MAKIRLFLDARKNTIKATLKVAISHRQKTAYIPLDVKLSVDQWDKSNSCVTNHPDKNRLNLLLSEKKNQVERALLLIRDKSNLASMDVKDIKSEIEKILYPEIAEKAEKLKQSQKLFSYRFLSFADRKQPSTRKIYENTYARMEIFAGAKLKTLTFEDITKEWLHDFDKSMMRDCPSQNSRNIHFRNIRAVFNEAIDDGITTNYPFRKFKIRPVATAKRNLKVEDLRTLFNYPCEPYAVRYVDMFKLMFMLIGINSVDLCHLKELKGDRIEYHRAKTKRFYSIKVEPEALEIINKYRGENWLLYMLDSYTDYHDFTKHMNNALKLIGPVERKGLGGKKERGEPLFPDISSYWARHSWATIAASLDIPKDTIAHALGHGGNTVTDIYIDFDQAKVDEANRKVLDWVLYGKK